MNCRICSHPTVPLARATVLEKYEVQYYRCQGCGFTQTEEPFWLDEAYSSAITSSDLGLIHRNIALARRCKAVLLASFDRRGVFLDFGGGYGLLVRMMRDMGFDFRWSDRSCDNLFARGFEGDASGGFRYDALTAFEVAEHLTDPFAGFSEMTRCSRNILFSTRVLPASKPGPSDWWYFAPQDGQHVSIYSSRSLNILANRLGLRLYTNSVDFHLLTDKVIPPGWFKFVASRLCSSALSVLPTGSLLPRDFQTVTGKALK